MLIHATAAQLAAAPWNCTTTDPDDLLMTASLLVSEATMTAIYDVDGDGHPTDPATAAALRDATCAQASMLAGLGGSPDAGGLDAPAVVSSKRVGSVSKSYDTSLSSSVTAFLARRDTIAGLSDRALRILQQAGLTNGAPL